MVPREQKRTTLHEKLQLLRSVTNSHAVSETSIIVDASKYIQELKQKVERANQELAASQISSSSSCPKFSVETLEKGFLVKVYSERSCPGLLVSLLEAFEELGFNVLEARVSCTDNFHLQAFGGENDENEDGISSGVVIEAVSEAIKNWSEGNDQD
ncbi:PREDICTED: transcription factor SCREAM2-like [Ipomoea nil]|uniref:transcription factor SCREAM2-like n=1 Tax=Ipomoea nil TaxID=35883 RepID=UPI000901DCED|nr:PREDICTED: transcription factor SCREAM2-like [Ipomoea nil]XP_019192196.1 PREDICTED: transcription factor SCREAM2-like [Ipomoea nil]